MKKIKSSIFSRGPKLIAATIKLGMGKDIDQVISNISELKGVPQKIGQLLSMDVTNYIPSEMKDKFKPLQGSGSELDAILIFKILKKELGEEKFKWVVNFQNKALGAGSIGQVHLAEIKDKKVVFKIQYPNIAETVKSDLALLTPMSNIYEFIRPESKDLSIIINEARTMLLNELDYQREIKFLNFFNEKLKADNRYVVPVTLPEFSNEKIICMEYVTGIHLSDFIISKVDANEKKIIAYNLLDLFIDEFFQYGIVQTDPNFANYLVNEKKQLVLLDFGAVKEFDKSFRDLYFKLLYASYNKNDAGILKYGQELGVVDIKDTKEAVDLFVFFMKDVMSYFRLENNPMDFSNETITKRLLDNGWKLWKEQRISKPNSNLVFLHRKLGGLFSVLKEMKLGMDLYPFWEKILKENSHLIND